MFMSDQNSIQKNCFFFLPSSPITLFRLRTDGHTLTAYLTASLSFCLSLSLSLSHSLSLSLTLSIIFEHLLTILKSLFNDCNRFYVMRMMAGGDSCSAIAPFVMKELFFVILAERWVTWPKLRVET
jgi:hypothetical protein